MARYQNQQRSDTESPGKYRKNSPHPRASEAQEGKATIDEIWPVHATARWPECLSLRREDMYDPEVMT